MQIGEVAQRVGLATSAIRFYEDRGLIPEPERTESGYRDYDPGVVERIRFIRAGQAVGLALRELNQVLQIRDGVSRRASTSPNCSTPESRMSTNGSKS